MCVLCWFTGQSHNIIAFVDDKEHSNNWNHYQNVLIETTITIVFVYSSTSYLIWPSNCFDRNATNESHVNAYSSFRVANNYPGLFVMFSYLNYKKIPVSSFEISMTFQIWNIFQYFIDIKNNLICFYLYLQSTFRFLFCFVFLFLYFTDKQI